MRNLRWMVHELRDAAGGLAALLWPGPCLVCGADLPARVRACICPACWASLPVRTGPGCPRCDLPGAMYAAAGACPDCGPVRGARSARATTLERTVAALVYEDAVVTIHRRLKFGGATDLVRPLAAMMACAWRARGGVGIDLVVPVPPDPLRWSARRRVPRLLARAVARDLGLPLARALRKRRPTRSLTGRPAAERRRILAGTFRARPDAVRGRGVLVVDDVATTGATLREAARALRVAGARSVCGLVLARTPRAAFTPLQGEPT